jgi:uncharacterized membrane protein|tara:strand:+ start:175 stop:558 length:384 start_codon:yes stop_codon:yes gene_type:complete
MSLLLIKILIGLGLFLSVYAFYVDKKINSRYKPACDVSAKISCTKAFRSKYGKILGISNSVYGILFYLALFFLLIYNLVDFVFYTSTISLIFSIYLIYILQFKLDIFCIVCYGIHLTNLLIVIYFLL